MILVSRQGLQKFDVEGYVLLLYEGCPFSGDLKNTPLWVNQQISHFQIGNRPPHPTCHERLLSTGKKLGSLLLRQGKAGRKSLYGFLAGMQSPIRSQLQQGQHQALVIGNGHWRVGVEQRGIEPLTSALRTLRSTN